MSFRDYLESKAIALCLGGIGILYLFLIAWLCGLPLSLLLILCFSGVLVLLIWMILSWQLSDRRLRMLRNRLSAMPEKYLIGETLPRPHDAVEQQYYLLMQEISRSAIGAVEQVRAEKQDYCDYVESWVHEIKTPLTACSLILANGGNPSKLRRELRRADNLTETILTYAKIQTVEKDTQISLTDLRTVCDQAVREEMELLIAAGISVAIEGDGKAYTDPKLISRIVLPALGAFAITAVLLPVFHLSPLSAAAIVLLSLTGTLQGIIIGLLIVTVSCNKLEGMAVTKLSSLMMLGAVIPCFVPAPFSFGFSFLPSFWMGKAMMEGSLLSLLPSIAAGGCWITVLWGKAFGACR